MQALVKICAIGFVALFPMRNAFAESGLESARLLDGEFWRRQALEELIPLWEAHVVDAEHGGFHPNLARDWSARPPLDKHPAVLAWERELTDLSLERMVDDQGWLCGFGRLYDRQWRRVDVAEEEQARVGAQLTAVLSLLRLYDQSGAEKYLVRGKELGERTQHYGRNAGKGYWLDLVAQAPPHAPSPEGKVDWWIQIYGSFLQLHLFRLTGEKRYLDGFARSEGFFMEHFVDREYGGIFASITPEGELNGDGRKSSAWHTAYHELEHCLLNYLYLNLYVNGRPAVLHFRFEGRDRERDAFVSLVDDPRVEIGQVEVEGRPWTDFDAQDRRLTLPAGPRRRVAVTLMPVP